MTRRPSTLSTFQAEGSAPVIASCSFAIQAILYGLAARDLIHSHVNPSVKLLSLLLLMGSSTALTLAVRCFLTGVYVSTDAVRFLYLWGARRVALTDVVGVDRAKWLGAECNAFFTTNGRMYRLPSLLMQKQLAGLNQQQSELEAALRYARDRAAPA